MMMYKNKEKRMGKMCGGKAHRAKKAMGGMMKGSQPMYGGTVADAMPKGAPI